MSKLPKASKYCHVNCSCEVFGQGEPIRSQEGALKSDLTELLHHGSVSRRLGYLKSPVLGMVPVVPSGQKTPDKAPWEGGWGRQKDSNPFDPLRFSELRGSTVTSATSCHCRPVVASSGVGARRVKNREQQLPWMSWRHPSSSCRVGARAGSWPRDASALLQSGDTPPLLERISWVATSIFHDLGHHEISAANPWSPQPHHSCREPPTHRQAQDARSHVEAEYHLQNTWCSAITSESQSCTKQRHAREGGTRSKRDETPKIWITRLPPFELPSQTLGDGTEELRMPVCPHRRQS